FRKLMTFVSHHRACLALALALFGAVCQGGEPEGDVVGKLMVGYQGWFACEDDGSPVNRWVHWSGSRPSPGNLSFEIWPDTREFEKTYPAGFAPLGNGGPAGLFSSYDDQVVETHFKWMRQHDIDTA